MSLFRENWILAILDVVVVAFIIYRLLLLIRGTRAAQMFIGLAALALAALAAEWLRLQAFTWIVTSLRTVWVIAFIILFQNELRRALAQIGQARIFHRLTRAKEFAILGEVVRAVDELAERKLGAIIVLERLVGVRNYIETGTRMDARVSAELLVTLFTPPSPLHDGAVIVSGDQIVAAGCILPLSQNPHLAPALGTRHRAALGLAEETDAVVITVSEETRNVSIAERGKLVRGLDSSSLRSELASLMGTPAAATEPEMVGSS
jgi:diadenylate cyclase